MINILIYIFIVKVPLKVLQTPKEIKNKTKKMKMIFDYCRK